MTETSSICFPPVADAATKVLILGSLPGVASLQEQQYYAHPRNHFWPIIDRLLDHPISALAYTDRLTALTAAGVGLWDVVAQAKRHGSLDSDIREAIHNPLATFVATLPQLRLVAFNGQTAGKAAKQLPSALPYLILPSTSPAYTLPLVEKWQAWQAIQPYLF